MKFMTSRINKLTEAIKVINGNEVDAGIKIPIGYKNGVSAHPTLTTICRILANKRLPKNYLPIN